MKGVPVLATFAGVLLVGCQPAHISVTKWDPSASGGDAQTRCEQVDLNINLRWMNCSQNTMVGDLFTYPSTPPGTSSELMLPSVLCARNERRFYD